MRLCTFALYAIFILNSFSCDAILESLIFSREKIEQIDLHFRSISTLLNDLGASGTSGSFNRDSLVELKKIWWKVYQEHYLSPPAGFLVETDSWRQKIAEMASEIGALGKHINAGSFTPAHEKIIRLQGLMVELYSLSKPSFFTKIKTVEQSIFLLLKSRKEKLSKDEKRLTEYVQEEWKKLFDLMSEALKNQKKTEWDKDLQKILGMSPEDFEEKGRSFFRELEKLNWEEM
jgi:hypothetical protein